MADYLQETHGLKPLLLGGPGEEIILHEIQTAMKTPALNTGDDPLRLVYIFAADSFAEVEYHFD